VLAAKIDDMIAEACAALGIEPGGTDGERWVAAVELMRERSAAGAGIGPEALKGQVVEMLTGACAALDIAPRGDLRTRWAAVLEAIRAKRAAVGVLGWSLIDKDNYPGYGGMFPSEALAGSVRDRLNRQGHPLYACAPWSVVPVGPTVELKPFGFGVIDKDGGALVQHVYRGSDTAEHSADGLNQASVRMESPLPDAPFTAVQLFYASPPDRPAEAAEPAPPELSIQQEAWERRDEQARFENATGYAPKGEPE
jgi:hypothetical protein